MIQFKRLCVGMEAVQLCVILLPMKFLLNVCLQEFIRHKNKAEEVLVVK